MNNGDIQTAVVAALKKVAPEADPESLSPEASVRDELDLDSMDYLGFITAIHDSLHIDVPEADYPRLRTVAGAVEYLSEKLRATH